MTSVCFFFLMNFYMWDKKTISFDYCDSVLVPDAFSGLFVVSPLSGNFRVMEHLFVDYVYCFLHSPRIY